MKRASSLLFHGVGVSLLGAVATGLATYLTRRVLARGLAVDVYGFFYSAMALIMLLITLLGGGLGHASIVLVARHKAVGHDDEAARTFGAVTLTALVAGTVLAGLVLLTVPVLMRRFFAFPAGGPAFVVMCLAIPVGTLFFACEGGLYAVKEFVTRNVVTFLQYFLVLLAAMAAVWRWGLPAAAWGVPLSYALVVAGICPYLRWRHGLGCFRSGWQRGALSEVWRFARWTGLSATGMMLMMSIDTLVLTELKGLESVAVYNIAVPIIQIFLVAMVVPYVFVSIATELWHTGRRDELRSISRFVIKAMTCYGWVLVLFLLPAAPAVIRLLFGAAFVDAALPLTILGVGVPLLLLAQFAMHVLMAVDRPDQVAWTTGVAVLVNIGLNLCLIPRFGLAGAAAASVAAHGIWLVLGFRLLGLRVGGGLFPPFVVDVAWRAVPACLAALLAAYALDGTTARLAAGGAAVALLLLVARGSLGSLWREGRALMRERLPAAT